MTELSELREKVNDLRVEHASLKEQVAGLTFSVDALRADMKPLIISVAKGKGYVGAIALVAAAIGASVKEAITRLFN